jgi:hypothetical protein
MTQTNNSSAFDSKVTSLVEATRGLGIPQVLILRRMTLNDPESLKWANEHQLNVVFNIILTMAVERTERIKLLTAMDRDLEPLLPPPEMRDAQDHDILLSIVNSVLGGSSALRVASKKMTDAEKVISDFEHLLSRRLPATPPRSKRFTTPFREAPPLFAIQGSMNAAAAKKAGQKALKPGQQIDFTALFDDTLCGHIRKILDLLRVPTDAAGPHMRTRLPFIVAPEFIPTMEDAMRRFILPQMRESRQIKALANAYNWPQVGGEQLVEIIQGSEINNPVLHNWDLVWNAVKAEDKPGKDSVWTLFKEDATNSNYSPPDRDHIRLIMDLIRYEPESIAKSWREIQSLAQQEFAPSGRQERARDGALRDCILKWSAKLPDFVGEFLAIKAAFSFRACGPDYMQTLLTNFGRNEKEQRRNAPFLSQYVDDLIR